MRREGGGGGHIVGDPAGFQQPDGIPGLRVRGEKQF